MDVHVLPVTYADDLRQAELVTGQSGSSVKIVDRASRKEELVVLPSEMAQVDEIRKGVSNKLLVRGMVNGSVSEVAIIDLNSAKLVDKFVCYLPSMSPDGRYIAFVKFYPPHFAEGTDDHYMIYDIAKYARLNFIRPQNQGLGLRLRMFRISEMGSSSTNLRSFSERYHLRFELLAQINPPFPSK